MRNDSVQKRNTRGEIKNLSAGVSCKKSSSDGELTVIEGRIGPIRF